jgi:hypothetical protein
MAAIPGADAGRADMADHAGEPRRQGAASWKRPQNAKDR